MYSVSAMKLKTLFVACALGGACLPAFAENGVKPATEAVANKTMSVYILKAQSSG